MSEQVGQMTRTTKGVTRHRRSISWSRAHWGTHFAEWRELDTKGHTMVSTKAGLVAFLSVWWKHFKIESGALHSSEHTKNTKMYTLKRVNVMKWELISIWKGNMSLQNQNNSIFRNKNIYASKNLLLNQYSSFSKYCKPLRNKMYFLCLSNTFHINTNQSEL